MKWSKAFPVRFRFTAQGREVEAHGATGIALRRGNVRVWRSRCLLRSLPAILFTTTTTKGREMPVIYLGEPTGPRLRSLSRAKEQELDAWLSDALEHGSPRDHDIPVDFTRALSALAKRRGIRFYFNGDRMRIRGEVALGKNIPGCVGGSKRKAKLREPLPGTKVEPYHEKPWRDDFL